MTSRRSRMFSALHGRGEERKRAFKHSLLEIRSRRPKRKWGKGNEPERTRTTKKRESQERAESPAPSSRPLVAEPFISGLSQMIRPAPHTRPPYSTPSQLPAKPHGTCSFSLNSLRHPAAASRRGIKSTAIEHRNRPSVEPCGPCEGKRSIKTRRLAKPATCWLSAGGSTRRHANREIFQPSAKTLCLEATTHQLLCRRSSRPYHFSLLSLHCQLWSLHSWAVSHQTYATELLEPHPRPRGDSHEP